ncbi:unnamed protein product, partial [marine sediment metagenome]
MGGEEIVAYVCVPCAEAYDLLTVRWCTTAACEICGPVHGDWGIKNLIWAPDIRRHFGSPDVGHDVILDIQGSRPE